MKEKLAKRIWYKIPHACLFLSLMAFFTILCFKFPEYLTTPEIRSHYPIPLFRNLIVIVLALSSVCAGLAILSGQELKLSSFSLSLNLMSLILGGSQVHLKEEYQSFAIHLGMDWLLLDLFLLALIFVPLEAFFPLRKEQKIARPEFKTDLIYFAIGHLGIQLIMLGTQKPIDYWFENLRLIQSISHLPILLQILIALLFSDLIQYLVHRLFHIIKPLWQFHKIHHSIKTLDWLAGSRLHIVDILISRSLVYAGVLYLGPSPEAFNFYILIVALQTVFIHSNTGFHFGFLNYLIVTPQYHHWHHNDRPETYDKNFCVHFPVFDILFGTFFLPERHYPVEYGIQDEDYPQGYWKQFLYGFKK